MNETYWSIDVTDKINIFIEVIGGVVYINKMDRQTLEIEDIAEIMTEDAEQKVKQIPNFYY